MKLTNFYIKDARSIIFVCAALNSATFNNTEANTFYTYDANDSNVVINGVANTTFADGTLAGQTWNDVNILGFGGDDDLFIETGGAFYAYDFATSTVVVDGYTDITFNGGVLDGRSWSSVEILGWNSSDDIFIKDGPGNYYAYNVNTGNVVVDGYADTTFNNGDLNGVSWDSVEFLGWFSGDALVRSGSSFYDYDVNSGLAVVNGYVDTTFNGGDLDSISWSNPSITILGANVNGADLLVIPEPSAYAAIFAIITLAFAANRRRR